jgi:hypothetical protein
MSKTQTEINAAIRAQARAFDIDDDVDALASIDAMMGETSQPTAEEWNGSMPADDALAALQFRQSPLWSFMLDGLRNIATTLRKKFDDENLPHHQRMSAADKAKGVEEALAYIGGLFVEAEGRTANLSLDEKVLIGKEGLKQISGKPSEPQKQSTPKTLPTEIVSTKKSEQTITAADEVAANTKSAIALLSKGAN